MLRGVSSEGGSYGLQDHSRRIQCCETSATSVLRGTLPHTTEGCFEGLLFLKIENVPELNCSTLEKYQVLYLVQSILMVSL